jgi:hypothetical protein
VGSQNLRQVEAMAATGNARVKGMTPATMLVLVVMAASARDDDGDRDVGLVYFRGWPHLATMLGYPEYDGRAERAVARHVADLATRGLVEPVARRGKRGNRVYRLHLLLPS